MNCVAYARVSTEEQKIENCSIPSQISKIESVIKDKKFNLLEVFKDEGFSGSKEKRPGLQEMLVYCQEHPVDLVYVLDTDRIARDVALHYALKKIFKSCGVKLESINQPMLDDTPEGDFMDSILAAFNAYMPKVTGRKSSQSMLEKVKLGWWPGPARTGYLNAIDEKVLNGLGRSIIVLDKEQAPHIKKAFQLFSTGEYTVEQLCNQMYEEGLRSKDRKRAREDKKIARTAMTYLLRDRWYIGKMEYKGEEYQGNHPAIIDEDTFILCNEILDQHNNFMDRKRKHNFLLNGHIHCGICGRLYTAEHHGIKEKSYYHCPAPVSVHSNKNQNIDTESLELAVSTLFKGLNLSPALIDRMVVHAKKYLSENHNHVDISKKHLLAQQTKLETRRNNLEMDLADRIIDTEAYLRQMDTVRPELDEIKRKMAKLGVKRQSNSEIFEQMIHLTEGIYKAYRSASPQRKRAYIDLFWDKIEVQDKEIKKAVPTKLFGEMASKECITANGTTSKIINFKQWFPGLDSNQD